MYEISKEAKEHETYMPAAWVPSSKFISKYLPYKERITVLFEAV